MWRNPSRKRGLEAVADDNAAAANGALLVTLGWPQRSRSAPRGCLARAPHAITATSSAAVAADSWSRWMQPRPRVEGDEQRPERPGVEGDGGRRRPEALTNTAFALIDVFFALAKTGGVDGQVADLQAQLPAERQALATPRHQVGGGAEDPRHERRRARRRPGGADEDGPLRPRPDRDRRCREPAGKEPRVDQRRGSAHRGGRGRGLPLLATKTAEEAKALVSTGIETLGPAQTLARGGGMAGIEAATHADATVLGRLTKWRDSLVGRVEPMLDAAETTEQARGFLADLAGIPIDQIETALGIGLVLATSLDVDVKSSVDGAYGGATLDLEAAVAHYAAEHGEPSATYDDEGRPCRRRRCSGRSSPAAPVPLTDRQLNMLSGAEFEDLMRQLIGSGHFAPEGLPTMSVMEIKVTGGDNGIDGIGLRRRGQYVDTCQFEFKADPAMAYRSCPSGPPCPASRAA